MKLDALKQYKSYSYFMVTIILFIISLIFITILYLQWDNKIPEADYKIEINLPIMDWASYENLSKKY